MSKLPYNGTMHRGQPVSVIHTGIGWFAISVFAVTTFAATFVGYCFGYAAAVQTITH